MPILALTAEKSFVIERHDNRYFHDTDTVYFDNLLGAYVDGGELVPVWFGLKHSRTGTTTLHVIVDQNRVALENLGETKEDRGLQDASPDSTGVNSLRRSVTYSISQIVPFVNKKGDNIKLAEITYDENGNLISISKRYDDKSSDIKYSLADRADREALTSAFYELAETDAELQIVEKYRSEIDGIDDYDKKKVNGKYQVGSGRVVAITHDTPFISNSIPDSEEKSNSFSEKIRNFISEVFGSVSMKTLRCTFVLRSLCCDAQQGILSREVGGC